MAADKYPLHRQFRPIRLHRKRHVEALGFLRLLEVGAAIKVEPVGIAVAECVIDEEVALFNIRVKAS